MDNTPIDLGDCVTFEACFDMRQWRNTGRVVGFYKGYLKVEDFSRERSIWYVPPEGATRTEETSDGGH